MWQIKPAQLTFGYTIIGHSYYLINYIFCYLFNRQWWTMKKLVTMSPISEVGPALPHGNKLQVSMNSFTVHGVWVEC